MRQLKKHELAEYATDAAEIAAEAYDEYEPESDWPCPCCRGEGQIRIKSERIEKRRQKRRERYVRQQNRAYRCLETSVGKGELDGHMSKLIGRPYFRRTESQTGRIVAWRKIRYDHDVRLSKAIDECHATCPICVECERIDDEWKDRVNAAVESVRDRQNDYVSSEDYGNEYAYLVGENNYESEVAKWWKNQEFPQSWSDLPENLRESIYDRVIGECRAEFVDGWNSSFDLTLDSFPIDEQEDQRSLDDFRADHDLQDCPKRIIADCDELSYNAKWDEVMIYTDHDPAHWTFGLNDDEIAQIVADCVTEYDGPGLRRRDRVAILDECAAIDGTIAELSGAELADVWVCYADSIAGGNCRPGTRAYMSAHGLSGHRLAAEMPEPNLREVRKAIRAAVARHNDELETGYCDLSYHQQGAENEQLGT